MDHKIAIIGGGNLGAAIAEGLNEMEQQGFSSSLIKGIVTRYKKITTDR